MSGHSRHGKVGACHSHQPAIVLMLAYHSHSVANRADALEISIQSCRLVGKALFRGRKRRVEPVRQNKRLAEKRASHFVQIADVDERDVAIEAERSQDRRLRILGIEPIDLVERRLDGKCAMQIDRCSSAEILVTLEHQNPVPGSCIECRGGQAAKTGADHDGVELPGHAELSITGNLSIAIALIPLNAQGVLHRYGKT